PPSRSPANWSAPSTSSAQRQPHSSCSNLSNRAGVLGNHRIRRQEDEPFDHGLRQQDSVEGIFVDGGQVPRRNGMLSMHGQLSIAILQQTLPNRARTSMEALQPLGMFD